MVIASVSENGYYTDRKKCFREEMEGEAVDDGKWWLQGEMTSDASWLSNRADTPEAEARRITEEYERQKKSLQEYEGREEAWEGEVTVDSTTYGYRLTYVYEPCEEMPND